MSGLGGATRILRQISQVKLTVATLVFAQLPFGGTGAGSGGAEAGGCFSKPGESRL